MISRDLVGGKDFQLERAVGFREETPVFSEASYSSGGDCLYYAGGKGFQGLLEEKAVSLWIESYEALCRRIGRQFRKKPESFIGSGSIV